MSTTPGIQKAKSTSENRKAISLTGKRSLFKLALPRSSKSAASSISGDTVLNQDF